MTRVSLPVLRVAIRIFGKAKVRSYLKRYTLSELFGILCA